VGINPRLLVMEPTLLQSDSKMFDEKEKKELLGLARGAIKNFLEKGKEVIEENVSERLRELGACFVTLTENNQLRGCIGSTSARRSLYVDVQSNAVNAAFRDPRFIPLQEKELEKIRIEVSVLSKPEKCELEDIVPGKHGVIIEKGDFKATFLPQVWEHFNTKEDFLGELCVKAGLDRKAWKDSETIFFVYEVVSIQE